MRTLIQVKSLTMKKQNKYINLQTEEDDIDQFGDFLLNIYS